MGCFKTKYGNIEIKEDNGFIVSLKKVSEFKEENSSDLENRAYEEICEYFEGHRKEFSIPIKLNGTQFQKKVWNELLSIPYGEKMTYKEIAESLGNKNYSRAVGNGCNKNPIWIIIPCHRVVGVNNSLTGYAGGLDMKERLLLMESGL